MHVFPEVGFLLVRLSQQTGHASEVIPDDGKFDRHVELAWPPKQRTDAETPVGKPPGVPNSEQP